MLGKLLKHEFSQTGRTLLPMFGGALATLLLAKLMRILTGGANGVLMHESGQRTGLGTIFAAIGGVTDFIFGLMLMALLFGTMIVIVSRFYRMLGDEGYVMFALPVTPAQHIWTKTISGVAWMVAAIGFFILSVAVLMQTNFEATTTDTFLWEAGSKGVLTIVLLTLCVIFGVCAAMWQAYLACTLGTRFGQYRLVASIGAFFIIQVALQVLSVIAIICIGTLTEESRMISLYYQIRNANPYDVVNVMLAIALGVLLVVSAVYYFVMQYNLSKKLNLA